MGLRYGTWPKRRPAGREYACRPKDLESLDSVDVIHFRESVADHEEAPIPVLTALVRTAGPAEASKLQAVLRSAVRPERVSSFRPVGPWPA